MDPNGNLFAPPGMFMFSAADGNKASSVLTRGFRREPRSLAALALLRARSSPLR
jgi:hypothetical protein